MDKWIKEIKEAFYRERGDHETCNYEFGCIVESKTLDWDLHKILSQAIEEARKEEREKVVKEFEWYSRHNYQTGYVQFNAKEYEDLLKKLLGKEEAK